MSHLIQPRHLPFLLITTLFLLFTSSVVTASPICEDIGGFAGFASLVTPEKNATLLGSQPHNITWGTDCFGWRCVRPGNGLVYLYLAQYFAPPPPAPSNGGKSGYMQGVYQDDRPVCLNLTAPLLQIAYGAPNSGNFVWDMKLPDGIKSDHNYVVMGSVVDKDRMVRFALQSAMFTIKRKESDIIDESIPKVSPTSKTPQETVTRLDATVPTTMSTPNAAAGSIPPPLGSMAYFSLGVGAAVVALL